jgi:Cu/Zn superoxide dismutase
MNRLPSPASICLVSFAVAALAACGKAEEKVSQKAAEKMIESAIEKDGSQAKVELSESGTKVTTTDASGKTSQIEMGGAKVVEADVGVPFYPGAEVAEGQSSKISTPDGSMFTVMLHSADPADKVAAFYRDKLKAQAEGKQLMDMSNDGNATLMLSDEKAKTGVQVHVSKADKGTDIQIVANRGAVK